MTLKSFRLDEHTLNRIKAIKEVKRFKSEKEVIVKAIEQYALSEMIEDESIEFKTLKKMDEIQKSLNNLNHKINHIDHGVSINNLFLASEFEINQHPKAIVDRDIFNSEYFISAKKEVTKLIREKDNYNRKDLKNIQETDNRKTLKETSVSSTSEDDWLNV